MERDDHPHYLFTLYISGMNPHSIEAVSNMQKICQEPLSGHYQLKIIDLQKEPDRAYIDHILAMPTLIKRLPLPVRQMIGDLSNQQQVMIALEIKSQ